MQDIWNGRVCQPGPWSSWRSAALAVQLLGWLPHAAGSGSPPRHAELQTALNSKVTHPYPSSLLGQSSGAPYRFMSSMQFPQNTTSFTEPQTGKNMTAGRLMLRRRGSCPAPEAIMSEQSSPGSPGCCIAPGGPQRIGWLGPGPACAALTGEARQGTPCEIRYCLLGRWSLGVG